MHIRSIFLSLFFILLHNNIFSQENTGASGKVIIFRDYPLTRLVFADSSYKCGHYDASNNILYSCWGTILLKKPANILDIVPDSLCCRLQDLDGDGVHDGEDRCINEKGPASNYGCPIIDVTRGSVHYPAMRTIFFESTSSYLSPESIKALITTVKFLKEWPDLNVNLDGHADNLGKYQLNRNLCMARIKAVRYYLLSAGIEKKRITYSVYGSKYPIEDNRTKSGRSRNRRVEFYIYKKSDK